MAKENIIQIKPLNTKVQKVTIVGDSDLVLNKMNDVTVRNLTNQRKGKAKDQKEPNLWEEIITSIHWRDPLPDDDRESWNEETMHKLLTENAPCITAFGMKKSLDQAVVRNGIDTYSTKFDAGMNILGEGGLIPVKFEKWTLDEMLMSPKKGAPVLVHLNRFVNWSAEITFSYTGTVYSLEQIVNIINIAGFGGGIGSGRSSGYGRYHIA